MAQQPLTKVALIPAAEAEETLSLALVGFLVSVASAKVALVPRSTSTIFSAPLEEAAVGGEVGVGGKILSKKRPLWEKTLRFRQTSRSWMPQRESQKMCLSRHW